MSIVFVDTVGLLALWDESDQWHQSAADAFQRIRTDRQRILTSSYVLLECSNAAARRPYREQVDRLRLTLEAGKRLVFPSSEDWQSAWNSFRAGDLGAPGVVDLTSFAVMRRLGIRQAFTNDRHFKAAGFDTLF
ncbi:MAG: PIN domain-containing protein [Planctomycetota bacterium]|nr:PIN domain-containing protein [Planctomycetota bacterium]